MVIAGVDEAGRGPLAGPVVAAAVILSKPIEGVTDSKALSEKKREQLNELIRSQCTCFAIGMATAAEIDHINIHQATLLAMRRAIDGLSIRPDKLLIDGIHAPNTDIHCECIIKGDMKEMVIGAASIIAKVERDRLMYDLDEMYPGYGFGQHKGYGTKAHKAALNRLGPCEGVHRFCYQPVQDALKPLQLTES